MFLLLKESGYIRYNRVIGVYDTEEKAIQKADEILAIVNQNNNGEDEQDEDEDYNEDQDEDYNEDQDEDYKEIYEYDTILQIVPININSTIEPNKHWRHNKYKNGYYYNRTKFIID
jgi:acetyl-CoA carboxylase carboxyltransferase component